MKRKDHIPYQQVSYLSIQLFPVPVPIPGPNPRPAPPPKIRLAMMAMMPAPVPAFAARFFPLDGRGSGPPERTAFFSRDASPRPTATRPPTPSTTRHIPTNNNVDIFPSFYQMTHLAKIYLVPRFTVHVYPSLRARPLKPLIHIFIFPCQLAHELVDRCLVSVQNLLRIE